MNKGTIVVVLAAAGLLGYLALRKSSAPELPSATSIPGYLDTAVQDEFQKRKESPLLFLTEKEEDRKKQFKEPAFDEITIAKKGASVTMKKEGADEWKLTAPLASEVEGFKVKAMLELFATDTALDVQQASAPADQLVDYGLDEKRAVKITIKEKGVAKVDVIIGSTKKLDKNDEQGGPESYDTFVMLPSKAGTVYVARRKDLRQPFDLELADLRSKKVFAFDLTKVSKITIEDPTTKDASGTVTPKIVVAATWTDKKPDPAKKDAPNLEGEKDKGDEKEGNFTLVEPAVAGFKLMEMRAYWSSLVGLRVAEFVMEKPTEATGLLDAAKVARVTLEFEDGKKQTVLFGAEKEKGKSYYAMLEGAGEYFLVSDFTRNNTLKSLSDFRDKNILGADADEDVTKITLKNASTPDGAMVFERTGNDWKLTPPASVQPMLGASVTPDETEMKALVGALRYLRVTDYLATAPKPDEVGLTAPAITVTAMVKGVEKTIAIGSVEKDSKVTARVEGTDVYFTLGNWTRDKLVKKPLDFKNKRLFSFSPEDVTAIELAEGAVSTKLERLADKPDAWKMTAPETVESGKGLDDSVASGILTGIKDFDVKSYTDKTKESAALTAPSFTLTLTLKDATTRKVFVSESADGEAQYIAVEAPGVDPNAVFTLDKFKIQNFRKNVSDFKTTK